MLDKYRKWIHVCPKCSKTWRVGDQFSEEMDFTCPCVEIDLDEECACGCGGCDD